MVSPASDRIEGEWWGPEAYDLFDRDGRLERLVTFAPAFRQVRFVGNNACSVVTGADNVESVRCDWLGRRLE